MTGTYAHAWLKVASRWHTAKRLRAPGILAGELSERCLDKSWKGEKQRTAPLNRCKHLSVDVNGVRHQQAVNRRYIL